MKILSIYGLSILNNDLSGGLDYFDIDLSNYLTGTYVYSIIIDGYKVKSGKFNIIK